MKILKSYEKMLLIFFCLKNFFFNCTLIVLHFFVHYNLIKKDEKKYVILDLK